MDSLEKTRMFWQERKPKIDLTNVKWVRRFNKEAILANLGNACDYVLQLNIPIGGNAGFVNWVIDFLYGREPKVWEKN